MLRYCDDFRELWLWNYRRNTCLALAVLGDVDVDVGTTWHSGAFIGDFHNRSHGGSSIACETQCVSHTLVIDPWILRRSDLCSSMFRNCGYDAGSHRSDARLEVPSRL